MEMTFDTALSRVADTNQPLDLAALNGLSNARKPDAARFAALWPTIPVERRRELMKALGALSMESFEVEFTPLYRAALHDSDAVVRVSAINNLWESESEEFIPPFLQFLTTDADTEVRAAAATGLGKYMFLAEMEELDEEPAERVREALLATIRSKTEDELVRRRAIEAISFLDGDEVRAIIENAYNDPSEEMQASAVFAMGRNLDPYWSGTVLLELQNANPRIRQQAAWASGELELKQAVPLLVPLLDDKDRDVLLNTVHALGQIGGPVAQRALELVADSDDEELAETATDALDELIFQSGDADWLEVDFNAAALGEDEDDEFLEGDEDDEEDEFDILWKSRDDADIGRD